MIVRITFKDTWGKEYTLLFGDSYKKWKEQLTEYLRRFEEIRKILNVEVSKSKWISFGGLKWVNDTLFQGELDKEKKDGKFLHRKYSEMKFSSDPKIEKIVRDLFKEVSK